MAGESAREVARRRREKAERLARQAELWELGAAGEEVTGELLDALCSEGWHTWHDVAWPGRSRANIDHVVIGPGGLFVIDSKHWSGSITVIDEVLRQNGRRRESAVTGASEAALAISRAMGDLPATGVLCFVRDDSVTGSVHGVLLCSSETVIDLLKSRPPVLHPTAVGRYAMQLDRVLTPARHMSKSTRLLEKAPAPHRSTRKEGGKKTVQRGGSPNSWRQLIGVALMLALALLAWFMGSATWDELTGQDTPKTHELGDSVTFEQSESRPPLDVTVRKVERTVPRGDSNRIAAGTRLVAVHLTIKNTGKSIWRAQRPVSVHLRTDSARTLDRDPTPGQVKAGRLLAAKPTIRPGKTHRRVVVFEVPKGSEPIDVRVRLDAAHDSEVRWVL